MYGTGISEYWPTYLRHHAGKPINQPTDQPTTVEEHLNTNSGGGGGGDPRVRVPRILTN